MPSAVVGGFLVLHGLITSVIGMGGVTKPDAPALSLPSWFSWWPGPFGRSWLFDALHLGTGAAVMGGVLWLVSGLALIGAGLGWVGTPVLRENMELLAFAGGALGLVALSLYFHPIYLIAILIDGTIVVLLWRRLVPAG
jgi:hypothetical protein